MSQKDAVFEIAKEILGDLYSKDQKMRPYFDHVDHYYHSKICDPVAVSRTQEFVKRFMAMVESGELKRPQLGNHSGDLKLYSRRILFNWLQKDPRLNGGKKYKPKVKVKKDLKYVDMQLQEIVDRNLDDEQLDALLNLYSDILRGYYSDKEEALSTVKATIFDRVVGLSIIEEKKKKAS